MAIEKLNFYDFALECDYFQWGQHGLTDNINGGYLCNHPEQEETQKLHSDYKNNPILKEIIGECHCYSCPLGVQDDKDEEVIIVFDE